MILLPKLNLVIITPGKTASTSLRDELSRPKYGAILLHGPQGCDTDYEKHTAQVPTALPEGMRSPNIAVVTRNPFDRAVSLWRHYCRFGKREIAFGDFVDEIMTCDDKWWFFRFTIMQTLEGTRFDKIIRFETLQEDLKRLGVDIKKLPDRNRPNHSESYRDYYCHDSVQAVQSWGASDFDAFGYDPNELNDKLNSDATQD